METVFICSVGIYRREKSSCIKINMNMTHDTIGHVHYSPYFSKAAAVTMINRLILAIE